MVANDDRIEKIKEKTKRYIFRHVIFAVGRRQQYFLRCKV